MYCPAGNLLHGTTQNLIPIFELSLRTKNWHEYATCYSWAGQRNVHTNFGFSTPFSFPDKTDRQTGGRTDNNRNAAFRTAT